MCAFATANLNAQPRPILVIDDAGPITIPIINTAGSSYVPPFDPVATLFDCEIKTATVIGDNAFGLTKVVNVSSNSILMIGNSSFSSCLELVRTEFPKVTAVLGSVFQGSTKLEYVDLSSVQEIGANTFRNCTSLETLLLGRTPPLLYGVNSVSSWNNVFFNVPLSQVNIIIPHKANLVAWEAWCDGNTALYDKILANQLPAHKKQHINKVNVKKGRLIITPQP